MPKILTKLQELTKNKADSIDDWFSAQHQNSEAFIYNSVDIRYSGDKIAPVDTNIFPAGFNNLSKEAIKSAKEEIKSFLESSHKDVKKLLIITEYHTRNLNYLSNVNIIKNIFEDNGLEVMCGSFSEGFNEHIDLIDSNDKAITLHPVRRIENRIFVGDNFFPDLIITNNDLTAGSPNLLHHTKQEIIPPIGMGWYKRKKYDHFKAYNFLAGEFGKEFDIDPFLISTELGFCKKVNFKEKKGIECIAIEVEKTLGRIQAKYDDLEIKTKPYVYIKANRGTYGMGIMSVDSADEVLNINKKIRNKMNVIKSNTQNAEILIQEGVETIDTYNDSPCEPFIYLVNGKAIGTILRVNQNRDGRNNLNSSGAEFVAADDIKEYQDKFSVYNLISRLAALAATKEDHSG